MKANGLGLPDTDSGDGSDNMANAAIPVPGTPGTGESD